MKSSVVVSVKRALVEGAVDVMGRCLSWMVIMTTLGMIACGGGIAHVRRCGNGVVEPGEACDDGNTLGGDGCSPTCQLEHDAGMEDGGGIPDAASISDAAVDASTDAGADAAVDASTDAGADAGSQEPIALIQGTPSDPDICVECLAGVGRLVEGTRDLDTNGFTTHGWDDRLVYDLGGGVDCGSLSVLIESFAPYTQFEPQGVPEMYVELVALYEGPNDDHSTSQSQIAFLYPPCFDCVDWADHYKMKVNSGLVSNCASATDLPVPGCEGHCANATLDCGETEVDTCDWDSANYTGPVFDPVNGTSFLLEVRWSPRGMQFHLEGGLVSEDLQRAYPTYPNQCYNAPKTPNLGYLFVGRPRIGAGGYLAGPLFHYLEVWRYDCSTVSW